LIEVLGQPSIRRQCELLDISRAAFYYEPGPETQENLELMRRLDQLHLDHPAYGSRRLVVMLSREGHRVNRKRVARLRRLMGLEAL
jgi:putative transposase